MRSSTLIGLGYIQLNAGFKIQSLLGFPPFLARQATYRY